MNVDGVIDPFFWKSDRGITRVTSNELVYVIFERAPINANSFVCFCFVFLGRVSLFNIPRTHFVDQDSHKLKEIWLPLPLPLIAGIKDLHCHHPAHIASF